MSNLREYIAEHWQHWRFGEQDRYRNLEIQGIAPDQWHAWRVAQAAPISSTPPTDPAWRWGIDLAGVYDGIIDATMFKAAGGSWVIVKAADGTITAKYVFENATRIKNESIPLGLYFWLYPNRNVSCSTQGKAWAAVAKQIQPAIGCVDYEWTSWSGKPSNPGPDDLRIAIDAYEQATGEKMWIYSAPGYLAQYPAPFPNNPLWLAQYGVVMPMSVTPWGNAWSMWQQSDRWGPAVAWGIDPNAAHVSDGDVMQREKFDAIFGGGVIVVPPPHGGDVSHIEGKVLGSLVIRDGPAGTALSPAKYLYAGDTIKASTNQAQWLKLSEITHAGVTRTITDSEWASAGGQQQYITWGWVSDPVIPPPTPTGDVLIGATAHFKKADGTTYDQELEVKE